MRHYTKMAIDYLDYDGDHSYPSPEMQLFWRLDDLTTRLEELKRDGAPFKSDFRYLENDIRYALPEQLDDINKTQLAIEYARNDLMNCYGIDINYLDIIYSSETQKSEYQKVITSIPHLKVLSA